MFTREIGNQIDLKRHANTPLNEPINQPLNQMECTSVNQHPKSNQNDDPSELNATNRRFGPHWPITATILFNPIKSSLDVPNS